MTHSQAPGVVYFESELLPGRPMFRCDRLSASLQVSRCAQMWRDAAQTRGEKSGLCLGCQVGAAHAGEVDASYHRLRATTTCSRCHRGDLRLIGGNVCVGCKNREYEWVKGRNAKGKFPACHPRLDPRRLVYATEAGVHVVARERTASTLELVVEVLRDSPKRALFGFGVGRVHGHCGVPQR